MFFKKSFGRGGIKPYDYKKFPKIIKKIENADVEKYS